MTWDAAGGATMQRLLTDWEDGRVKGQRWDDVRRKEEGGMGSFPGTLQLGRHSRLAGLAGLAGGLKAGQGDNESRCVLLRKSGCGQEQEWRGHGIVNNEHWCCTLSRSRSIDPRMAAERLDRRGRPLSHTEHTATSKEPVVCII